MFCHCPRQLDTSLVLAAAARFIAVAPSVGFRDGLWLAAGSTHTLPED